MQEVEKKYQKLALIKTLFDFWLIDLILGRGNPPNDFEGDDGGEDQDDNDDDDDNGEYVFTMVPSLQDLSIICFTISPSTFPYLIWHHISYLIVFKSQLKSNIQVQEKLDIILRKSFYFKLWLQKR